MPAAPTYSRTQNSRASEIRDMPKAPKHPAFCRQPRLIVVPEPAPERELSSEEVGALRTRHGATVKACRSMRYKFRCASLEETPELCQCWKYDTQLRTKTTRWNRDGIETYLLRCPECLRKEGKL